MRYYVKINGVSSLTIPGLAIRELPSISKTLMRNQKETIDGRDGDLITELGYSAYDKTLQIGLFGTYDINQIIAFFNQKGTIVFSDEDDKYYNFTILDQIDYDKLVKFRTASVRIHCQPFKYPLTETPIVVEPESVTGEGTNITLNNTGVAKLSVGLKGNTYQETTTGKNLLPKGTSTTRGGVTFTVNADGSITIDTGGSAASSGNYIDVYTSATVSIAPDTTKTYTYTKGIENSDIGLDFFERINNSWSSKLYTFNTSKTYTPTGTQTGQQARIFVKTGATINNVTVYPMIVEGTETGDYEPYTNGASPNPSYPQEVQVVTGNQNILVQNKNLASLKTSSSQTIAGLPFTIENGIFKVNGTASSNGGFYFDSFRANNGTATFSFEITGYTKGGSNNGSIILQVSDDNTTFTNLSQQYFSSPSASVQVTLDSTKYYRIRPYFASGNVFSNSTLKIQLEYGSTKTDFVEHQEQNYEINLGKNLFKGLLSQFDNIGGTGSTYTYFKLDSNKTYTLSATAKNDITVASNRYLGLTNQGGSTTGGYNWLIKQGDTFTQGQTVSLNSSASRNYVSMYSTSQEALTYLLDNFDIQLEVGSQATSYSPYKTPIELCKIGTYQDYLYKSEGNWYKHKEVGKITLNGSENWNYQSNYNAFYLNDTTSKGTNAPLSNYFKGITSGITTNDNSVLFNTTTLYLIYHTLNGVITGLQTWLSTHNTSVYYVLATPTDETITNEALIEELNNLYNNAVSYLDQTNINSSGDLPFIISASALKKGTDEAIINNGGNIYAKPILALEGTGIVGLYLDGTQLLSIDMTTYNEITIDTNNMEAYDPNTNQLRNRQITGDYNKLKLQPGNNTLSFSGDLTSATISKYKRWL